jgi:hypothetical protein
MGSVFVYILNITHVQQRPKITLGEHFNGRPFASMHQIIDKYSITAHTQNHWSSYAPTKTWKVPVIIQAAIVIFCN